MRRLIVDFGSIADDASAQFESRVPQALFGFRHARKPLVVEAVSVEAIGASDAPTEAAPAAARARGRAAQPRDTVDMHSGGRSHRTPVFDRATRCSRATSINGPAIIAEANATTVVEPGWQAEVDARSTIWCSGASRRVRRASPSAPRSIR